MNTIETNSPELKQLEDSIKTRKLSCADLVEKNLSMFSFNQSSGITREYGSEESGLQTQSRRPPPISTVKTTFPDNYDDFLLNHPDKNEVMGVEFILDMLSNDPAKVHFANISSSEAAVLASKFKE